MFEGGRPMVTAWMLAHWCGRSESAWSPKCELVIHATRRSYLAAVGAGGKFSYGSSQLDFGDHRRLTRRRIDICGDDPRGLSALPHELTHVIVAECFDGRRPPRWADEGMAILADRADKQRSHRKDMLSGVGSGTGLRVAELLTAAFYGQSAWLTELLVTRGDPPKFIHFLRLSLDQGYDHALRETYGIENTVQLDRLWREAQVTDDNHPGPISSADAR
jgi:hypothetical protein